jgi:ornithine--oxo-acid transaminase
MSRESSVSTSEAIELELRYGAHNYHPMPVVLERGEEVDVWDTEGNHYYDFLAAYSAVNQGHCHPRIQQTLVDQSGKLPLTSRAFHSDLLGRYEKYMCELFGYDKLLPMNTGAEGVETALKICRKWGHEVKGIEPENAKVIVAENNFHGRTITVISFSTSADSYRHFGPHTPGFEIVPYDDAEAIEQLLEQDEQIAGVMLEPIQGEAGVILPSDGYLKQVEKLCDEHNVLLIDDEIQTGLGRTGQMLAADHDGVRPDLLILGKALSGGMYPVSAVLADDEVMEVIKPGEHGSTYGGNPLGCAVAMTAVDVILDEELIDNAVQRGRQFRDALDAMVDQFDVVREVRGKGLMNAIETNGGEDSSLAWDLCMQMKNRGLLAKPTHGNKIRFTPPLIISEEQITKSLQIIEDSLSSLSR